MSDFKIIQHIDRNTDSSLFPQTITTAVRNEDGQTAESLFGKINHTLYEKRYDTTETYDAFCKQASMFQLSNAYSANLNYPIKKISIRSHYEIVSFTDEYKLALFANSGTGMSGSNISFLGVSVNSIKLSQGNDRFNVWKFNDVQFPNSKKLIVGIFDASVSDEYISGTPWDSLEFANALPCKTQSVSDQDCAVKQGSLFNGCVVDAVFIMNSGDNFYPKSEIDSKLDAKVDKIEGKGLSTNDYSNFDKDKVSKLLYLPISLQELLNWSSSAEPKYPSVFIANLLALIRDNQKSAFFVYEKGAYNTYVNSDLVPVTVSYNSSTNKALLEFNYNGTYRQFTIEKTQFYQSKINSKTTQITSESGDQEYPSAHATYTFVSSHTNDMKNPHNVSKSQLGLSNVDNTSDANKPISAATQTALNNKVDKVTGKGLSTNDFTSTYKSKLDGIANNATRVIVNDTLESTSAIDALSAAKGKELKDYIIAALVHKGTLGKSGTGAMTSELPSDSDVRTVSPKNWVYRVITLNNTSESFSYGTGRENTKNITCKNNDIIYCDYTESDGYYWDFLKTPVVDSFDSTSATSALSVKKGRELKLAVDGKVDKIGGGVMKFSQNLASVAYTAFMGKQTLTSVILPNTVTTIDGLAFVSCSNLESFTIYTTSQVPTLGSMAFAACPKLKIYVPSSKLSAYKSSWSDHSSIIYAIENEQTVPTTELRYTTSDSQIVTPTGMTPISNEYLNKGLSSNDYTNTDKVALDALVQLLNPSSPIEGAVLKIVGGVPTWVAS